VFTIFEDLIVMVSDAPLADDLPPVFEESALEKFPYLIGKSWN